MLKTLSPHKYCLIWHVLSNIMMQLQYWVCAKCFAPSWTIQLKNVSTQCHILYWKKIKYQGVRFCIRTYSDKCLVCEDQESRGNNISALIPKLEKVRKTLCSKSKNYHKRQSQTCWCRRVLANQTSLYQWCILVCWNQTRRKMEWGMVETLSGIFQDNPFLSKKKGFWTQKLCPEFYGINYHSFLSGKSVVSGNSGSRGP